MMECDTIVGVGHREETLRPDLELYTRHIGR